MTRRMITFVLVATVTAVLSSYWLYMGDGSPPVQGASDASVEVDTP